MAWAVGSSTGARGTAQEKPASADTTLAMTVANANVDVGEIAIAWGVCDNDSTVLAEESDKLSIADSKGNTWTKLRESQGAVGALAGLGVIGAIWASKITTQLVSGTDTLTLTTPSVIAKAVGLSVFTVAAGKTWEESAATAAAQGSSSSPSVTSNTVSSVERLWLGFLAMEVRPGDTTQEADYTNTTAQGTVGAPVNSNVMGRLGYRIATLTSDTYAPTANQSGDWANIIIALTEVDEGGPPPSTYTRWIPRLGASRAAQRRSRW